MSDDSEIVHHPIPGRFATEVDGHLAHLDYEMDGEVMHITHTVVPEPIGGRGVASRLVRAAVEHARNEGFTIKPVCSYAEDWFGKHPDAADVLAAGAEER